MQRCTPGVIYSAADYIVIVTRTSMKRAHAESRFSCLQVLHGTMWICRISTCQTCGSCEGYKNGTLPPKPAFLMHIHQWYVLMTPVKYFLKIQRKRCQSSPEQHHVHTQPRVCPAKTSLAFLGRLLCPRACAASI